jgi:hypothetical protein
MQTLPAAHRPLKSLSSPFILGLFWLATYLSGEVIHYLLDISLVPILYIERWHIVFLTRKGGTQ